MEQRKLTLRISPEADEVLRDLRAFLKTDNDADDVSRIDHGQAYSLNGVYSNGAESFFSRMRRGEIGHHHHVAGPYLVRYAQEAAWREDNRRVSNGDQVQHAVALALTCKPSVDFTGYWQRHKAA